MGKEARRAAAEQAGGIRVRIGRRNTRSARKRVEQTRQIFLPVKKGEAPLRRTELVTVFAQARAVKTEVVAGTLLPGPVELDGVNPDPRPTLDPRLTELVFAALAARKRVELTRQIFLPVKKGEDL